MAKSGKTTDTTEKVAVHPIKKGDRNWPESRDGGPGNKYEEERENFERIEITSKEKEERQGK